MSVLRAEGDVVSGVVHIAGPAIQIDGQLRQRCSWCGALLLDYALGRVAVPVDQDARPATWAMDACVAVDGNAQYLVGLVDSVVKPGEKRLPDGACGRLDPEVTA